jgi:hypothetical protein
MTQKAEQLLDAVDDMVATCLTSAERLRAKHARHAGSRLVMDPATGKRRRVPPPDQKALSEDGARDKEVARCLKRQATALQALSLDQLAHLAAGCSQGPTPEEIARAEAMIEGVAIQVGVPAAPERLRLALFAAAG